MVVASGSDLKVELLCCSHTMAWDIMLDPSMGRVEDLPLVLGWIVIIAALGAF